MISHLSGTGDSRHRGGEVFRTRITNRVDDADLLPPTWTLDGDGEALEPAECVLCPNEADHGGLCERCARAEGR